MDANLIDRLEHGRPIEPSRFLQMTKLAFDSAHRRRDVCEAVRLCGAVQVVRLAQRFGNHTRSIDLRVHSTDRARQVVCCNRKQAGIRLLGLLGVDARLGILVGEKHSVGRVIGRPVRGWRQAHRSRHGIRYLASESFHRDGLVEHLDHVEIDREMLERRQIPVERGNENDRDVDTVTAEALDPDDTVDVGEQTVDDEQRRLLFFE